MIRTPRRAAFTLVELLVVISIIGILLALTTAAVVGVRRKQQNEFSEATLTKLDTRIQDKMRKITDQINSDVTNNAAEAPTVVSACGGNKDVAKAVMLYARMRQQLPMSYYEAKTSFIVAGWTYRPPAAFATLPTTPAADPYEESAVCFYAAVAADGLEGLNFQQGNGLTTGLPVFLDGFGTPIAFVRLGYDGNTNELNPTTPAPLDPFFPAKGHNLGNDYPGFTANFNADVWLKVRPCAGLSAPLAWVPPPQPLGNWNSYPGPKVHKSFLVSAGPNKQYIDTNPVANLYGGDNLLSFRLRKEGGRGD